MRPLPECTESAFVLLHFFWLETTRVVEFEIFAQFMVIFTEFLAIICLGFEHCLLNLWDTFGQYVNSLRIPKFPKNHAKKTPIKGDQFTPLP